MSDRDEQPAVPRKYQPTNKGVYTVSPKGRGSSIGVSVGTAALEAVGAELGDKLVAEVEDGRIVLSFADDEDHAGAPAPQYNAVRVRVSRRQKRILRELAGPMEDEADVIERLLVEAGEAGYGDS